MRTASLVLTSLLLALPAAAQEPTDGIDPRPFALIERFEPGERWSTCGGLRFQAVAEGRPSLEASIAWTHSVVVVARPDGFALRGTLTSLVWEERRGGVLSVRTWNPDGPGLLAPVEARTWTFAFDREWALVDVAGPERSIQWLLDELRPDPAEDPITTELDRRLARRATLGVESFLLASSDHLGQPVRRALASLGAGPILPGRSWELEPRHGPAGRSTYLGLEGSAAHFQVAWEGPADHPVTARFVVDARARLRWMNVRNTEVAPLDGGALRATTELAFGIVRVEGEEPAWAPALLAR